MPPHLHPRSRLTTSLFTTTLAASFLVVALPHVLPCPTGPQTTFADGEMIPEGQRRRRRQRACPVGSGTTEDSTAGDNLSEVDTDTVRTRRRKRECPVPKPGGLVGEILGFKNPDKETKTPLDVREEPTSDSDNSEDKETTSWRGKKIVFTVPVHEPRPGR